MSQAQNATPIPPESTVTDSVTLFDLVGRIIGRIILLNLPQRTEASMIVPETVFAIPTSTPLPPAILVATEAPVTSNLQPTFTPDPLPREDERVTLPNGDVKVLYSMVESGKDYFTLWEVIYNGATNAVIYDSRDYISNFQIKSKLSPDATRLVTQFGLFSYPDLGRMVDFTAPEVGVGQVIWLIYSDDGTGLAVVSVDYKGQDSTFRLHLFDVATGALNRMMKVPYGNGSVPDMITNTLTNLGFPLF